MSQRPEHDEFSESVAEFMQRNRLKIDLPLFLRPAAPGGGGSGPGHVRSGMGQGHLAGNGAHLGGSQSGSNGSNRLDTLDTPCTEFVAKELRTPEVRGQLEIMCACSLVLAA